VRNVISHISGRTWRRTLSLKRERNGQEAVENYILWRLIIDTFTNMIRIIKSIMSGKCSTHEEITHAYEILVENMEKKELFHNSGVDGRKILRCGLDLSG
jgi:hypothetical protein